MKLISWNVNGLRSVHQKSFLTWLTQENPDILCLQEIKANQEDLAEELLKPKGYHAAFNCAEKKGYAGVAIYSRQPLKVLKTSLGHEQFDREGRLLIVETGGYIIANLYMPHGGRGKEKLAYKLEAYHALFSQLKTLPSPLILAGDFNIAHTELDLARPQSNRDNIMFTPEERALLDNLAARGFVDTFRHFHPTEQSYSWWPYAFQARERNVGWRIDYLFASSSILPKVRSAFILSSVTGSDHCPVGIEI